MLGACAVPDLVFMVHTKVNHQATHLEAGPGHSIFLPRTTDVLTVGKWKCNFYITYTYLHNKLRIIKTHQSLNHMYDELITLAIKDLETGSQMTQ